ncbi:MAG: tetratricopeptide repeat protein [Verrucomicrobiaceae bacterium]|nr:MAG: tetratricopeptide repeat protein [Verrucomicrobiaceae bacterium]
MASALDTSHSKRRPSEKGQTSAIIQNSRIVGQALGKFHGLRDVIRHGVLILIVISKASATPFYAEPNPAKAARMVTLDELNSGFKRGLFIQVAEAGEDLLKIQPNAPIKGIMAISFSYQGRIKEGLPIMSSAEAAKEPDYSLHRSLFNALHYRFLHDRNGELEEYRKAIDLNHSHPIAYLLKAETLFQSKKYQDTVLNAETALQYEPKLSAAFFVRGMASKAMEKPAMAFNDFNNAAILDPRDLRPRLAMAEMASSARNNELAARLYSAVLTIRPDMPQIRELYLNALIESRFMEEARKEAAKVLVQNPNSGGANLATAKAAAWFGQLQEAVTHFQNYLKVSSEDMDSILYLIGICELANDHFVEARQALEKAATTKMRCFSLTALGVLHHRQGRLSEAAKTLEQALTATPPIELTGRIYFHLGMIDLDLKNWNRARNHLNSAASFVVNLEPEKIDFEKCYLEAKPFNMANSSMGALLLADKMPAQAAHFFHKSDAGNPLDVIALFVGSNAAAQQLEFGDAIKRLERLIVLQPEYWPAHYGAALVELSQKHFTDAIPHFEAVLKRMPHMEASHLNLIGLYRITKQPALAEAACVNFIENNPLSPAGYNELGSLLGDKEDAESLATALEAAKRAVEFNPNNGLYLDTLGWIQCKLDKIDEALTTLKHAISIEASNTEIQYHLGAALVKAGKPLDADIHLRLALAAGENSDVGVKAAELLAQLKTQKKRNKALN